MNSYEYYKEIQELYKLNSYNGKFDKNVILKFLTQCENLAIIAFSELEYFINEEFSKNVCDILLSKNKMHLKLIFGDKVLAKKIVMESYLIHLSR